MSKPIPRRTPTRRRSPWLRLAVLLLAAGCGDEDLTGNLDPDVRAGGDRIWEASATDLPSAFDFLSGRRLFLGSGNVSSTFGDVFLEGPGDSAELRLRSISSLVRGFATHQVALLDLGAIDFDGLDEVPADGYVDEEDSTGVAIVQGHVYALRIQSTTLPPNFAKLVVDAVGGTAGPARFIDFRYALQIQPGNPRFEDEDDD